MRQRSRRAGAATSQPASKLGRPIPMRVGEMQAMDITPDCFGLHADEVSQTCRPGTAEEFVSLGVNSSLGPLHGRRFVVAVPHAQGVRNGEPKDRKDQIPGADCASFLQLQATFSS